MAEFHMKDRVRVLYLGRPLAFIISGITTAGNGEQLYAGDGSEGWHPESRLDYDLSDEQKDAMRHLDICLWNAEVALDDLPRRWAVIGKVGLPASTFLAYKKRLDELVFQVRRAA